MHSLRIIRENTSLVLITIFLFVLIITLPTTMTSTTTINRVYGQLDQLDLDAADSSTNIQNTTEKIVQVGDIDVAYKMLGKGDPILLIQGHAGSMDDWEPSILKELSSNHTVIIFDSRGVKNTTTGTKQFSIQQFANDTAGLLDALKIQKANVLGHSMGSIIAQQLALTHPEKVNRLILVSSSCGGNESIPQSPEVLKLTNKLLSSIANNTQIEPQEIKTAIALSYGPTWIKLHPNLLETLPTNLTSKDLIPSGITRNTYIQQGNALENWKSTNWSGVCSELPNISKPTLVITGTEDVTIPAANSLIIAGKIPGAWLVQIPAAGHTVIDQYPEEISKILNTFLDTTTTAQASNATSTATAATAAAGTNNTTATTTTTTTTTNSITTAQPTMNLTST